jgi:sulfane dehydrogenase subunit SoxC
VLEGSDDRLIQILQTRVRLAALLEEAMVDPRSQWILAEGANAAGMSRSIPIAKAMDDAILALYQNGERIRASNGYPIRLLLPGYEGNMNVKWLRRIKVTEGPTMTKDETSKYTISLPNGKALQFVFPMEGRSVITRQWGACWLALLLWRELQLDQFWCGL